MVQSGFKVPQSNSDKKKQTGMLSKKRLAPTYPCTHIQTRWRYPPSKVENSKFRLIDPNIKNTSPQVTCTNAVPQNRAEAHTSRIADNPKNAHKKKDKKS